MGSELAHNGDGIRTSKSVAGDTAEYVLDLAATLPVVVSDTEAVYLYGLDSIAQQEIPRQALRAGLVDTTGQIETSYAYDSFVLPAGWPADTPGG